MVRLWIGSLCDVRADNVYTFFSTIPMAVHIISIMTATTTVWQVFRVCVCVKIVLYFFLNFLRFESILFVTLAHHIPNNNNNNNTIWFEREIDLARLRGFVRHVWSVSFVGFYFALQMVSFESYSYILVYIYFFFITKREKKIYMKQSS